MLRHLRKYLKTNTRDFKYLSTIVKKQHYAESITCKTRNCVKIQNKSLHFSTINNAKLFAEGENSYAYKVLQAIPITTNLANTKIETNKVISNECEFSAFLEQNWRCAKASDITQAFLNVKEYCQRNNINVSDNRFDNLVDGLMDNVEKLSTNELSSLLACLIELPKTDSPTSHNFHDIWSALDDLCCWKMKSWDLETCFKFAELWSNLYLARMGDYVFEFINKISRKPERLSQQQLVHAFFYMNVCRNRPIEFEWEDAIQQKLESFTVDQMAILAMGFFKTQTKVKLTSVLKRMLELVTENADSIHEISLSAILKVLRISQNPHTADNIVAMLDKIAPQIPRFSHICTTHIALAGTNLTIFHETTLKAIAQKIIDSISNVELVRLKDIERILLPMTMFDFDPKTTVDFYKTLYEELHKEERTLEKVRHPKCIPCALVFLSARNFYSEQLMNDILDPEFTRDVYGKSSRQLPRELFFLDVSSEIDFPEYKGKRWTAEMRQKASKWLQEHLPSKSKKSLSYADKLYFNVIDTVNTITGNSKYLYIGHVLPQYARPDIILCIDRLTNEFVEPTGIQNYPLGQIMRPVDSEKYKWYALLIVSFNMTIRYTAELTSSVKMKRRHLEAIGYEPILVKWNEYNLLKDEERIDYILNKLKRL